MASVSDNNFLKAEYSEFEKKCRRLEQENLYLRKLLNIAPDQVITIPNKVCDITEAQTTPIQKYLETISNNSNILEHDTNEDFSTHTKDYLVSQPDVTLEPVVTLAPQEKIKLYRRLFHGREDVFASRWENKNGRAGYSPACANEWDRKVCRKPQIKCSECSHSKWLPITDQVIHDHLTGKKFLGVYPLNLDENCYFLALDFDKDTWQKDAVAFFKICQNLSIPAVLERSQSGNGAHIWIFFANAISARLARSLGTALLSRTMQECHTLRMESYDRLFPNQDTLPKGGFGNLIALPLQGNRRKEGNSIFLNDKLEPYNNPWELLEKIRPMEHREVMSLLGQLEQQGNIMDVRLSQTDEENLDPWVSNKSAANYPVIEDTLPSNIELVLANLIYIPIKELSPKLINQLKKITAFQNPEFYRKQAMRLSTYGKPRIIYCAQEFMEHLGLPRGCEDEILALFKHYGINVNITDEAQIGNSIDIDFVGELREEQKKALEAILPYRYGILSAVTAFGKTVLAARIIAERKTNTLILVHRQQLLDQWRERLSVFLGISTKSIGTISNGRNKLTGNIDIAMLQSLSQKGDVI